MGNSHYPPSFGHAATGIGAYFESEQSSSPDFSKTRTASNRHRNRGYALEEVTQISDQTFLKMFRMTRGGFEELLGLISPFMHDTDEKHATYSSGSSISKRTKLFVTLRWLAGGSHLDICFAWGIAESTFYSTDFGRGILWPTIEAIDQAFVIGLPFHDEDELRRMADEFSIFSHGELYGCITAIDGWVARTRKPFREEVDDIMAYRNRHGCWGLLVLAGCDARCRFTMFSCKNSGSTNDIIAWELSLMKQLIENENKLPQQFFIIGDKAFNCTNQLLVPYSRRGLGVWKDSFNFHLSVMRQCIERAFAILTQRWGILWRDIRCSFDRWTLLLTVLAKLHNYCLNKNIPLTRNRFYEDEELNDEPQVILNENQNNGNGTYAYSNRRAGFTRELELRGVRRPNHAAMNSRA